MTTQKGVWNIQQVRDKQLQDLWSYVGADPGELWVWGGNNHLDAMGVLGQNNLTHYSSPVQVPGTWNDDPRHCIANSYSFCHTKSDGTLWAWGLNWGGALGQNNKIRYSSPVQVGSDTTWAAGQSNGNSSWGIKTDGTFWHWGRNTNWSMGINQPSDYSISSPVQLPGTTWSSDYGKHELQGTSSMSIKTDGTLWTWGTNHYGMLGHNQASTNYSSPKQVGSDTDWSQVTGGYQHSLFLKTDGTLWSVGEDGNGRLGINVGDNAGRRSSPTQVPGTTWSKVSAGYKHSVATKTDGTLWAWGDNSKGQLGQNANTSVDGYSSPVQVPGTTWNRVTAGEWSVVAIKTDGTLWTWGENQNGELANNSTIKRSSPTQIPGTNWSGNIGTASRSFFSIRS